jgi:filamentous hemagglutinin
MGTTIAAGVMGALGAGAEAGLAKVEAKAAADAEAAAAKAAAEAATNAETAAAEATAAEAVTAEAAAAAEVAAAESAVEGAGKSVKLTEPSMKPNPEAEPSGHRESVNYKQKDINNILASEGENEAAQVFIKNGYKTEQKPQVLLTDDIRLSSEPDYRIEGEIFDCYTPVGSDKGVRGMWSEVYRKVVIERQTKRVVINLEKSQWNGGIETLIKQFQDWEISGLIEVFAIDVDGTIVRIFPK